MENWVRSEWPAASCRDKWLVGENVVMLEIITLHSHSKKLRT
jgi:hypothetical protein